MTSEALLVRHCEAAGSAPEAPLTERGHAQAALLAGALAGQPLDAVLSSPYRRAVESAEPLAARAGLRIEVDARLHEWEPPWIPDAQWPDALRPILGGESPLPAGVEPRAAAVARGRAALAAALARHPCSMLVTHGKLLALLLGELQGRDPFDVFVELRNPHVFAVREVGSRIVARSLWHPG